MPHGVLSIPSTMKWHCTAGDFRCPRYLRKSFQLLGARMDCVLNSLLSIPLRGAWFQRIHMYYCWLQLLLKREYKSYAASKLLSACCRLAALFRCLLVSYHGIDCANSGTGCLVASSLPFIYSQRCFGCVLLFKARIRLQLSPRTYTHSAC